MSPRFHETIVPGNVARKAEQWCHDTLGPRWQAVNCPEGAKWTMFWCGRASLGRYRVCFIDEQDLVVFLLRWL